MLAAERVPKSKKLIKLTLDLGFDGVRVLYVEAKMRSVILDSVRSDGLRQELIARACHTNSRRSDRPFTAINWA